MKNPITISLFTILALSSCSQNPASPQVVTNTIVYSNYYANGTNGALFLAQGQNPAQSIDTGVHSNVVFSYVVYDNSNAFNTNTGKYTVPKSGAYHIDAKILFNNFAWTAGTICSIALFTNSVIAYYSDSSRIEGTGTAYVGRGIHLDVYLKQGDVINIGAYHESGSTRVLWPYENSHYFSMHQISGF